MVGRSCGENMVFEIISKLNGSCVDKCVCAYNFVQNNIGCDRCDWDEDDANDNGDNDYSMASFSFNILNKFTIIFEIKNMQNYKIYRIIESLF